MFFRPSNGEFYNFKGDPSWIEVTAEQFQQLIQWRREGKKLRYDTESNSIVAELSEAIPAKLTPLAVRHKQRMAALNTDYDVAVNRLTAGYPVGEIQTWERQEQQARNYDKWLKGGKIGAEPATPFVDILWSGRKQTGVVETKEEFIVKILRNADLFAPAIATLTAVRHGFEKQLNNALVLGNRDALEAVKWNFTAIFR